MYVSSTIACQTAGAGVTVCDRPGLNLITSSYYVGIPSSVITGRGANSAQDTVRKRAHPHDLHDVLVLQVSNYICYDGLELL